MSEEVNNQFKIERYNRLGQIYFEKSDFTIAKKYFYKMSIIAKESKNIKFICLSSIRVGLVFHKLGKYSKAQKIYLSGYEIAKKMNYQKLKVEILMKLGIVEIEKGNFFKAELLILEAIEFSKKHIFNKLKFKCYINLGVIYISKNLLDKALNIFTKALFEIRFSPDNLKMRILLYGNIAFIFDRLNNIQRADKYYHKSISISKVIKKYDTIAFSFSFLAMINKSNYKLSKQLFEQSFKYLKKVKNEMMFIDISLKMINVFLYHNKLLLARRRYDTIFASYERIENIDLKVETKIIGYKIQVLEYLKLNSNFTLIVKKLKQIESILAEDIITKDTRYRKVYNKEIVYNYLVEILGIIKSSKYKFKGKVFLRYKIKDYKRKLKSN